MTPCFDILLNELKFLYSVRIHMADYFVTAAHYLFPPPEIRSIMSPMLQSNALQIFAKTSMFTASPFLLAAFIAFCNLLPSRSLFLKSKKAYFRSRLKYYITKVCKTQEVFSENARISTGYD